MLLAANLLLILSGLPLLLMTLTAKHTGPEGPVGAHMVTAPLALGQALALGLGIGAGRLAPLGLPTPLLWLMLPGLVVSLTVLPITALGRRRRGLSRLGVCAAVLGGGLTLDGSGLLQGIGALGPLANSLVGYGMLSALWLQSVRNQVVHARAEVERQSTFEQEQAQWQLGEWQKLPAAAAPWQLIQFTHSFHADVKTQCLQRLGALPDLEAAMQQLLGTGWAEHALPYLRDHYPRSRAPLAPALSAFLLQECERWTSSLRGPQPGSWYANLQKHIEVAELCAGDGGDVRQAMQQWATMLTGKRGLESLQQRAARLAA